MKAISSRLPGILLILALLLLWEASARLGWVESVSWPSISNVSRTWFELALSGELVTNILPSLERMFIGYLVGSALAIAIGLLMGYFRFFFHLLEPLVEILRPIPSPAYIPIVILFLGIDDEMKIFMIGFASFFPVLLNTYSGVRSVEPVQIDTGRTLGLNRRRIVQKIVIPAALPYIFTGLRISLGISLILMVIAELVASNSGIGFFILQSQRSFRVREMYAGVITLGMLGYLMNRLFLLLEGKILKWHLGAMQREG